MSKRVKIEEEHGGFVITIIKDGEKVGRYLFSQEESVIGLVDVFDQLGIEASYEEVY